MDLHPKMSCARVPLRRASGARFDRKREAFRIEAFWKAATMKLYGIANCDTVKKARAWLAAHDAQVEFHDFRKHGIDKAMLLNWVQQTPWETLLNRRGTTWRQLPESVKAATDTEAAAIDLMLEKPSVIKRPVLEYGGKLTVGFDETTYQSIFSSESTHAKQHP
jgi:arsenate reductase